MLGTRHVAVAVALLFALPVRADWSGYMNTRSSSGFQYGYLATSSVTEASGKLRLVCLSDNTFKILFDQKVIEQKAGKLMEVTIDSLPGMKFRLSRLGADTGIGDKEPEFWKLMAQMAAGRNIAVGTGAEHRYSLAGFTKAYRETCGLFEFAYRYEKYLHLYR